MITGIPDYNTPIEQSIRCICGLRYLVFFGDGIGDAEGRARGRAAAIGARFVDARAVPWLACECGEVLGFIEENSLMTQ